MATIKDLTRMCKETKCKDCPFSDGKGDNCLVYSTSDGLSAKILVYLTPDCFPDNADEIVDKWVSEHPVKTYMQDFFEKFPNARKNAEGAPAICPQPIYPELADECHNNCFDCWNQEMKEE